jgi:hypothetical protein
MIKRLLLLLFCAAVAINFGCRETPSPEKFVVEGLKVKNRDISFGDKVRIVATPATQAAGVAGRMGTVTGFTTPSVMDVKVVGEVKDDFAFSVTFENPNAQAWFAPELLELVDHAPGQDIQIGQKRWVRRPDGGWEETSK